MCASLDSSQDQNQEKAWGIMEPMSGWKKNDRVKVAPHHYGSGMQGRLGTVLRTTPSGLVEVELDSFYQAGIGIIAFKSGDLVSSIKKKRKAS